MLQTKVVRDVENVESMLQQVSQAGTSAAFTLAGALTLTAARVPEFVPLFLLVVPCSAAIVAVVRRRSATRNEQFRRRVEELNARVDEMAQLMPITRAHGLESVALHRMRGTVEEVGSAGLRLDMINGRLGAFSWVTYQLNLLLGFLRPGTGQILLDGVDMEEVDLHSYRRFLSVVPQESLLSTARCTTT